MTNFHTYQLLRLIGSPFADRCEESTAQGIKDLYHYARKNRMLLLYIDALRKLVTTTPFEEELELLNGRFARAQHAIYRVSSVLEKVGIPYALFKSIRPYREVTVDIDTIVFGSAYSEAIHTMHRAGYQFLGDGPLSSTFRDVDAEINLDMYNEIGVSRLIYLDKDILASFVNDRILPGGNIVRSLSPDADLLALIAHSVIKEHMYVLSEYYTTLYYLAEMKDNALENFLSLIEESRTQLAAAVHIGTTALLHFQVHKFVPSRLEDLLERLGIDQLETKHLFRMNFSMPHKYHLMTIARALLEKLPEEKARRSFGVQALMMARPQFTLSVAERIAGHMLRETY